jgi:hypothetical protein
MTLIADVCDLVPTNVTSIAQHFFRELIPIVAHFEVPFIKLFKI